MYTTITSLHKDYKKFKYNFIKTFENYGDIIIVDNKFEYKYKKFKDYYIRYTYKNKLLRIEYFNYSGEIHKKDGPASIWYTFNGRIIKKEYYLNGKYHREDGPAIICYHENGKISNKSYWLNGKRHREDGSAYIYYHENGKISNKSYWLNHEEYSYEDYLKKLSCIR